MADIEARLHLDWPSLTLDVDLTLPSRGVTVFFGPSGSGKTTLLRCIAGLERARNGFVSFKGDVWQDASIWVPTHKRPLAYVFQEASLFSHLTVLGNLRYGLQRVEVQQGINFDQIIGLLGIGNLLKRRPDRLSGGERQRVAIARALAVSPRLLLMDEPLSGLDLKRKREILPYLERLHDELAIPVLYVTHSPEEVARLADHLVVIQSGRVVADGSLTELLTRLDPPIHLGDDAGAVLDATVSEIDEVWHLVRLDFPGGCLWTRNRGVPVGHTVRVRILASDVSLARQKPIQSSIQNTFAGRVDAIADDEHPGLALVRVRVAEVSLLARLTKRAVKDLGLSPGQEAWVQVKSVALVE